MLTKKQHELLLFIDRRLREDGVSPSYDEMKDALGLVSKSGIHRLVSALEERGFVRRLAFKARALEVLKLPKNVDGGSPSSEEGSPKRVRLGFEAKVITPKFAISGSEPARPQDGAVNLPLFGRIAAGTPIEALRNPTESIDVSMALIKRTGGDHYALEVDGESMIEAGILDGDTVIIEQCDTAETGDIVVALVEDEEVTLKRLRKKGHSIALEPANANYETRIYGPDQVRIQGKMIGLMRRY